MKSQPYVTNVYMHCNAEHCENSIPKNNNGFGPAVLFEMKYAYEIQVKLD